MLAKAFMILAAILIIAKGTWSIYTGRFGTSFGQYHLREISPLRFWLAVSLCFAAGVALFWQALVRGI